MATLYIALLRGINVGGKNRLPMTAVADVFAEAGCTGVRTYIQSGNVLFGAAPRAAKQLTRSVPDLIARRHGVQSPVIIRPADELGDAIGNNPFLAAGVDPGTLHIAFLADAPSPEHAAALDPRRSPGDSFHLRGRDLYLHLPAGVARTKLTNAYLDATLGTISTVRSWRTVLALHDIAGSMARERG